MNLFYQSSLNMQKSRKNIFSLLASTWINLLTSMAIKYFYLFFFWDALTITTNFFDYLLKTEESDYVNA